MGARLDGHMVQGTLWIKLGCDSIRGKWKLHF